MHSVRVWDLPTRLFHWLLLVCVVAMVATAQLGVMEWHFRFGYAILSLLLFRLVWGFIGGHWARFGNFVRGPGAVLAYLRGTAPPEASVGHNPIGALSVLAMLGTLALQVGTGLCADDEIASAGPMASHFESAWVSMATYYHTKIGKFLLISLVVLHVGAIIRYRLSGNNLVQPMLNGDKELEFPAPSSRDGARDRMFAFITLVVCASGVAFFIRSLG